MMAKFTISMYDEEFYEAQHETLAGSLTLLMEMIIKANVEKDVGTMNKDMRSLERACARSAKLVEVFNETFGIDNEISREN